MVRSSETEPSSGILPLRSREAAEARGSVLPTSLACESVLRVLVADNNKDAADTLAILLGHWGHDVRLAYDGTEVLELAKGYLADVFLLNISMPKTNGYLVAQAIRRQKRFQSSMLVAITGFSDSRHRESAAVAGFHYYLVKPAELSALRSLLDLAKCQSAEQLPNLDSIGMGHSSTSQGFLPMGNSIGEPGLVLIVDDHLDIQRFLTMVLTRQGFRTAVALHGGEALSYLRNNPAPQLILLDLRMPGMGGEEFLKCRQVGNLELQVPVVICSGEPYAAEVASTYGISWCGKPFRVDELLAEVARHCGNGKRCHS